MKKKPVSIKGRKITIRYVAIAVLAAISVVCVPESATAQSRLPPDPINFLGVTDATNLGDRDQYQVVFYQVPASVTSLLYFAVYDPDSIAAGDMDTGDAGDTTSFYLYGGPGALSDSAMRVDVYGALPSSGTQLQTFSAPDADTDWFYFNGVSPDQGERIGDYYYFRIVVDAVDLDAAGTGTGKNVFQLDVSLVDGADPPTGSSQIRAFAYSWTVVPDRQPDRLWEFFPFVPEGDDTYIRYTNHDFDGADEGVMRAYDASGTRRFPDPAVSEDGGTATGTLSTTYDIGLSESGATWKLEFVESTSGVQGRNVSELFFEQSDDGSTGTGEYYRTYAAPYDPAPAEAVLLQPEVKSAATGSDVDVIVQIVDAAGEPVPAIADVYLTVDGSASITSPAVTGGAADELVTTDRSGIAVITVNSAASETVTVTATTDGTNGSSPLPFSGPLGSNTPITISYRSTFDPNLFSASDTTMIEGGTGDLPLISVSDVNGVAADIVAANNLYIRIPADLNATFDQIPDLVKTGAGGGVVGAASLISGNTVLEIPITVDFGAGDEIDIGGTTALSLDPTGPSIGKLEMSFSGISGPWNAIDSRTIRIQPNLAIWDGSTSTDWGTAANWDINAVPDSPSIDVIIPGGPANQPTLDAARSVRNLQIGSGATLTAGAETLSVTGTFNNEGEVIYSPVTGAFGANVLTADQDSGTTVFDNGGAASGHSLGPDTFYDVRYQGAATTTRSAALTVLGDLTVSGGSTLDTDGTSVTLHRNLSVAGTFTNTPTGSLTLAGAATSAVSGSNQLGTLSSTTPGKRIVFQNGDTQTINTALTLSGSATQPIILESDTATLPWNLDVTGATVNVDYVDVSDSDLINAGSVAADFSTDSGGNDLNAGDGDGAWSFPTAVTIWDGETSTDTTVATNWVGDTLPPNDGTDTIVIPDAATTANDPILAAAIDVANLTVETGGIISLFNNAVTATSISNRGTIVAEGAEAVTINGNTGSAIVDFDVDSGTVEYGSVAGALPFGNQYYDLVLGDGGLATHTLQDALTVNGDLTIASSYFLQDDATGDDIVVNGSLSVSGTLTPTSGIISVTGSTTNNGSIRKADGAITLSGDYAGTGALDVQGTGSIVFEGDVDFTGGTLGSVDIADLFQFTGGGAQLLTSAGTAMPPIVVNNAGASLVVQDALTLIDDAPLDVTAGTLVLAPLTPALTVPSTVTGSGGITIGAGGTLVDNGGRIDLDGDWDNTAGGGYTATGIVRFLDSGVTSTITGDTTFNSVAVPNTVGAKTIQFAAGATQTVTGSFDIQGPDALNRVVLASTASPSLWLVDLSGAAAITVDYVDVSDSDLIGTAPEITPVTPESSVIDGNSDIYTLANDPGGFGSDNARWNLSRLYTWDRGGGTTDWNTAANWDPDAVPTDGDDVSIPALGAGDYPIVPAGYGAIALNDLTLAANTSLAMQGNDLTVVTNYTSSGTLRLRGDETTVSLPASPVPGIVEYYGPGGTVTGLVAGNGYDNLAFVDNTQAAITGAATQFVLTAALDVNSSLNIATGYTLDLDGQNLDVTGVGTFTNTGVLELSGNETITNFANLQTAAASAVPGTVRYTGNGDGVADAFAGLPAGYSYVDLDFVADATADTLQLGANLNVDGTWSATSGVLDAQGNTINASGAISLAAGTFTSGTGGVTFDGATNQSVDFGTNILNSVTFAKSDELDTVSATGNAWDIDGTLTLTSGTWDAGAFTHDVAGSWDSSNTNFAFTEGASTINLTTAGPTVTTEGATDPFNSLAFTGGATIGSDLTVSTQTTADGAVTTGVARALDFGNLLLAGGLSLDSTGGTIAIGTINGAFDLTLAAGAGATTVAGVVGGTTPPGDATGAAITINSTGTSEFQSTVQTASGISQADAAGEVTFRDNVTVAAGDTATTFNGNVVLDGLTFDAQAAVTFGNAAGDTLSTSTALVTVDTVTNNSTVDINSATSLGSGLTVSTGSGLITLDGTVNDTAVGTNALTLNTTGTTDINGVIGGTTAVGSVTTNAGGTTELGANVATDTGDQTYNDAVTLAATVTLSGTTGSGLTFNSTVNGGNDLTTNMAGATTAVGAVGGTTVIGDATGAAITINSTGTSEFQSTVQTASGISQADAAGEVTFRDNVTVAAGDTATTFNGNVVLDGLTFDAQAAVTFGNAAGDTLSTSTALVTVDTVTNNSTVDINSATSLGSGLTVSTGSGLITLDGTVNDTAVGTNALTLNTTGTTDINGVIGGTTAVGSVTTNAGGTTELGANVATDTGDQTYNDAVTLAATVTLSGTTGSGLTFNSTVNGGNDLTTNMAGATTAVGAVGGTTVIGDATGAAITINSTGTSEFQSTVQTASGISQADAAGEVTFRDNVTVAAGDTATTFNGNVVLDGLTFDAQAAVTFGNAAGDTLNTSTALVTVDTVTNNSTVDINSATSLGSGLTVSTGSGLITLDGTVNDTAVGTNALTLNTTGTTDINGVIGGTTAVGSVTTNAGGTTELGANVATDTGDQTYNDAVTLAATVTLSGTTGSGLTFNSTVNGGNDLTTNMAGATTAVGAVGGTTPIGDATGAAITINSTGTSEFQSTVQTASGISQADAAGEVTFRDNVTVAAGDTASTLNADVVLDGLTFVSDGAVTFGNTAADALTLQTGTVTLQTTGAGDTLTVNAATDGGVDLILDSADATSFAAAVGGTTVIGDATGAAITINSTGTSEFQSTVQTASGISQADAAGEVTFRDNVTVAAGDTATTFNGNVVLDGLTFDAQAAVTFGNAAGDTLNTSTALVTVDTVTNNSTVDINSATSLGSGLTVSTGSGLITLDGTVNDTAVGTNALTLNTTGTTDINGVIGGTTAVGSVTTNAGGTTELGANVATDTGDQTYNDAVTLAATVTLSGTTGSGLTFNSTVNGGNDLTTNMAGATTAVGAVGGTTVIGDATGAAITINSTGTSEFQSTVQTASGISQADAAGEVTFRDNVTVAAGDTATTFNGNVVLDGLTFDAQAAVTFGNAAGDTLNTSTALVTVDTVTNNSTVDINSATSLGSGLTVSTGSGLITLDGTVNDTAVGTNALTLNTTGTTDINGVIGGTTAVGSVTTNAGGTTELGANVATDTGDQTYNDAVTLAATVTLSGTTGSGLTFNSTVNGGNDLTTNMAGATTAVGAVGGTTVIGDATGAAITINSTGTSEFQSTVQTASGISQADAAGEVTFRDNVTVAAGDTASTLNADVVLDGLTFVSDGAVTFGNTAADALTLQTGTVTLQTTGAGDTLTVNAATDGGVDLILDSADATSFAAAVGGTTVIGDATGAAITINSTGTSEFQSTVQTASGISQADAAGEVTFRDNVTVAAGDTATTFNGNVVLDGLTFDAQAAVTFGNAAGDTLNTSTALVTVDTVTNNSTVDINSATSLGSGLTVSTGSGLITLDGTVNDTAVGTNALTLNTTGTTDINGVIGGTTAVGSVTTNAGGTTELGANVATDTGDQTYNDAVTLAATVTLSGTTGSGLTFNSTVNGGNDLTTNMAGATTAVGAVGGTTVIGDATGAAITINSTGTSEFQSTVQTASGISQADAAGEVTFRDNVTVAAGDTASTLNADVVLDGLTFASDGSVTFGNTAADALTLQTATVTLQTTGAGDSLTINATTDGGVPLTMTLADSLTFNAPVGSSTPVGTMTVTAATDITFNDTVATAAAADLDVTLSGTLTLPDSIGATDLSTIDVSLGGDFYQAGAGSATISGDIQANNTIQFAGAITLEGDVQLYTSAGGGFVDIGSTVNGTTSGQEILAIRSGGSDVFLEGDVGGSVPLEYLLFGEFGAGASLTETTDGSLDFSGQTLFIDAPGSIIDLGDFDTTQLLVNELILYRGTLDIGANDVILQSVGDVVVLGPSYNPDDADRATSAGANNALFAYPGIGSMAYYPGPWPTGGSYVSDGDLSTAPAVDWGSFAALDGGAITVGGNFYANGADMTGTAASWTLDIQDNSASDPIANGPFGSPYAVFFNGAVSYGDVVGGAVSAAVPEGTPGFYTGSSFTINHLHNNVSDGGNNDVYGVADGDPSVGWDLEAPWISSAEIVKDNVIRVTFNEPVENTNDELVLSLEGNANAYTDAGGGSTAASQIGTVSYDNDGSSDALPFNFSSTTGIGDRTVIYLETSGLSWNTDATGSSLGGATSTDRTGTHQTTIPDLSWLKGLVFDAGGKNPGRNYTYNGFGAMDSATDESGPVLYQVLHGKADYNATPTTAFDGHNYFHLYYSEPVTIGALGAADGADLNIRSDEAFTVGTEVGGDILDGGAFSGERWTDVVGYFRYLAPQNAAETTINSGNLARGTRPDAIEPGTDVTSNALYRNGTGFTQPAQELRIYLSGFNQNPGTPANAEFPGWHVNVPDPAGVTVPADVEVFQNDLVEDTSAQTNPVDFQISPSAWAAQTVAGFAGWDVIPPQVATNRETAPENYEIITRDTTLSGFVNRLEFHVLDDQTDDPAWDPAVDHPDGLRGLRFSTLNYAADSIDERLAFRIEEDGFPPVTVTNVTFTSAVNNLLFGNPNIQNDPYFALDYDDTVAGNQWSVLSPLWVSYDYTQAYATDLAGNLLGSFSEWPAIERTPPRIDLALAIAGDDQIYVEFSEPVFGANDATTPISGATFTLTGTGVPNVTGVTVISTSDDTGGVTAGFLDLDAALTANNAVGALVGPTNDTSLYDAVGNPTPAATVRRVTDVALGVVEPVWATDTIHVDSTFGPEFETLRTFDGTGRLAARDITLQARIVATDVASLPMALIYDLDVPDSARENLSLPSGSPRYWYPSEIPGLVEGTLNTAARVLNPYDSSGALRNYFIPESDPELQSGATLEFQFRLGTLPAARHSNPGDPRQIEPWAIQITGILEQRGGVTILNNVINPDNAERTILTYELDRGGMVLVQVFTLDGNLVRVLQRGRQGSGNYNVPWDGTNAGGRTVTPGIYFVRVVAPGIDEYRKVMVVD